MTAIAIVGGGRAATLHAEAVRATGGATLVGVGGRSPGRAGELADALDTQDLPLDTLIARADAVVVAVPPREVEGIVAAIPHTVPVLVESPVGLADSTAITHPRAMTAVNLLHAPLVRRGLAAVAALGEVHHLTLRMRVPRPAWGRHGTADFGGVLLDPAAQVLPVLLSAAAAPVTGVAAELDHQELPTRAGLTLNLDGGRAATATLEWADGPAVADLEAAGPKGAVALELWPNPVLEVDGRPVDPQETAPPLVALGFVAQVRRLVAVSRSTSALWPPIAVGEGTVRIADAATVAHRTGRFCHLE